MLDTLTRYKKSTDVQKTWREFGWRPPSEDPEVIAKWMYYRTLDTEAISEVKHELPQV